jgi:hypothetical protein
MLKIQEFILKNPNWKEVLTKEPYSLIIKEKDNLVLFNYTQGVSDIFNEIVKESRGLVLEKGTWKIVRYGFYRFYNIGESAAAQIDWESATATSKEDGSLIFLYYYNGWKVGTRSNFYAEDANLDYAQFKTFKNLFDYIIKNYSNFSFDKLNKNRTYLLEMCSRCNKAVITYEEPRLYHILTRDNITLEELDEDIGIPKPKSYRLDSEKEYLNLVDSFDGTHEGIVVKDKFNNRLKIKTELYFELHHLVNNHKITTKVTLNLIKEKEQAEFLAYFPEYTEWFEDKEKQYNNAIEFVNRIDNMVIEWKENNPNKTRKDFAKYVEEQSKKLDISKTLFYWAYEGQIKERFNQMTIDKIIDWFHIT